MRTGSKRVWVFSTAVMLFLSVGTGFAMHQKQSHTQASLQSLQTARLQLRKASTDAHGHRSKALRLINQAIAELATEETP